MPKAPKWQVSCCAEAPINVVSDSGSEFGDMIISIESWLEEVAKRRAQDGVF